MREVIIDGSALTVEDVVAVARGQATALLSPDAPARMEHSRSVVINALRGGAPVYGVNTGFGALADTPVSEADLTALQAAIIRSHAAGVGEPLGDDVVRAVLLLRARTLTAGYSGVRADLPRRLLDLLAQGLLPVIPGKGSVGASGDLAQLAHLAQPLIGEGRLREPGGPAEGRPAADVLSEHGLEPLRLAPKEGLSLVNGTEPMQAVLAFSVHDAAMLVQAADVACALSIEALLGTDRPYDERVQALRPHPGQLDSAANLRALLAGSPLLASHRHSRHAVQDAYCLRCAPQVHGAVRDVLAHARRVLETELGSVVDNPIITDDGEVMTTGNFHGEPLAFAADMLAMALAELASISERRVDRMLDPAFSRGLPPFLAPEAGTNSGFMLAQYTAASLVSENKVLAHPASVDTIPTSGKQEDHVSMGWTSVRKLREVVANVRACLAVEMLCAAQGIDLRASIAEPSAALGEVHAVIRGRVPRMDVDREVALQIAEVNGLLPVVCAAAATATGGLRLAVRSRLFTFDGPGRGSAHRSGPSRGDRSGRASPGPCRGSLPGLRGPVSGWEESGSWGRGDPGFRPPRGGH
jgi:histidine ammonia-lyase